MPLSVGRRGRMNSFMPDSRPGGEGERERGGGERERETKKRTERKARVKKTLNLVPPDNAALLFSGCFR